MRNSLPPEDNHGVIVALMGAIITGIVILLVCLLISQGSALGGTPLGHLKPQESTTEYVETLRPERGTYEIGEDGRDLQVLTGQWMLIVCAFVIGGIFGIGARPHINAESSK